MFLPYNHSRAKTPRRKDYSSYLKQVRPEIGKDITQRCLRPYWVRKAGEAPPFRAIPCAVSMIVWMAAFFEYFRAGERADGKLFHGSGYGSSEMFYAI